MPGGAALFRHETLMLVYSQGTIGNFADLAASSFPGTLETYYRDNGV